MAAGHTSARRRDNNLRAEQGRMYVYGNAVPKPTYEPERRRRKPEKQPSKKVSRQVKNNRRKALRMSKAYVVFLGVAALLALVVCVNYIQLQSKLTSRSKNISALQEELAELKEENNTRYHSVTDSVNLEKVREKAQKELGMVYASPEQVVEYDSLISDYVKQYEEIPEDGVLAQSDKE